VNGGVLITGAGRRAGAAIARRRARDGWGLYLHCRASREETETLAHELIQAGARAEVVFADLAQQSSIDAMCDTLAARSDWTGLVNSAASFVHDEIDDFDMVEATAQIALNLVAPVYLARKLKVARDGAPGFAINIADQKVLNPNPDFLSYTLAKNGLAGSTGALAMALAPNIRLNCIAPGLLLPSGGQTEEQFATVHNRTLTGRGATPEQLAEAVAFFAAADNVTGALLPVDGGQHLVRSLRDVMFT